VSLDGSQRSLFNSYTDIILVTLADKVGDTIQKVRASAEEAFLAASGHPQFGVKMCLSYVTNDTPHPSKIKKGKKPVLTSKHLAAK
jgi:hypothetical protein